MKSPAPSRRDRLRQMLADLHMPGALEALDAILHGVDGATLTAAEAIEQLLGAQIQLRNNRRLQAAMRSSRLPAVKRLTEFDFSFQPSLRREQMESLHELGFVERRDGAQKRLPLGDRQSAVGEAHRAADDDHREHESGNAQEPDADGFAGGGSAQSGAHAMGCGNGQGALVPCST